MNAEDRLMPLYKSVFLDAWPVKKVTIYRKDLPETSIK